MVSNDTFCAAKLVRDAALSERVILMQLSPTARLGAAFIALIAWAALIGQLWISAADNGGVAPALWVLLRYFTILTNLMVALVYTRVVLRNQVLGDGWMAALTLWILIVGVVYHLLLAGLVDPQGFAWWVDQGLHSAVPALVALVWIGFLPKHSLNWHHAALWLFWPLAYLAYALIRGGLDGTYPYFFIDAGQFGYTRVALNSLGLCLAFYAGGLGIVGTGKLMSSRAIR